MPFEILLMILAFLFGVVFNCFFPLFPKNKKLKKTRHGLYQITVIYLLFKIGFIGGGTVLSELSSTLLLTSVVVVTGALFWTFFVLQALKKWSGFPPITQMSIAAHFGSVSVGTFIAAIAFLEAMEISVGGSTAIWLALMELPAIVFVIWKLGINWNDILLILKKEWTLLVLPIAIVLGIIFTDYLPKSISAWLFDFWFLPILLYFLFEVGRKSADSLGSLKGQIKSVLLVGIIFPIIGGAWGTSLGYLLGYSIGNIFILGVLMASASYVLAPLCMQELLKKIYHPNSKTKEQAIAVSMGISVGVTLPFNILIGFELYYWLIKGFESMPNLALLGFAFPFVTLIWIYLSQFIRES